MLLEKASLIQSAGAKKFLRANWSDLLRRGSFTQLDFGVAPEWVKLAAKSSSRIEAMRNSWAGETVVCVGNGPSLAKTDLSLLHNRCVIGVNRAYQAVDFRRTKDFRLIVQDSERLLELSPDLSSRDFPILLTTCHFDRQDYLPPSWFDVSTKEHMVFLPAMHWQRSSGRLTLKANGGIGFSNDFCKGSYLGFSVIFSAIQLALYMGAKKIVCIGIDMDYSRGVSFAPGVKNIAPNWSYEDNAREMLIHFRERLARLDVALINSTPGGRVDVLDRLDLRKAI